MTSAADVMQDLRDRVNPKLVFGSPIERDGTTLLPVAALRAGGAIGRPKRSATGDGKGGFGLVARPVGAWLIRDGRATWMPTVNANRIAVTALIAWASVAVVAILVFRRRRSTSAQLSRGGRESAPAP